jgi:ParB family chromosome partitioning protein
MSVVKISEIIVKNINPRTSFDETKFNELVESIKERGILQPIICRRVANGYELIAGNRRYLAAKKIGLEEVPIVLRETAEEDIQVEQLIENLQREDMSAEDKYNAFMKMKVAGYTISQISKKTGVNSSVISSILGLESLNSNIRSRPDIDEYPKQLIAKAPVNIQIVLADRVAKGELVVRCLLEDVLPTIKKIINDSNFSGDEKEHILNRIAKETVFREYPAKSIFNQEIGKKKMQTAGIMPKIVSSTTLEGYIKDCKSFTNTLFEIQSTHLQYLDKSLVLRLYSQLTDIRDHISLLIPIPGGHDVKK